MSAKCPYEVLGVSPQSEQFVIEAAYRAMLKKYHPDVNKTADAARRTQEIVEAYRIVGNPSERARYDAKRQRGAGNGTSSEKKGNKTKPGGKSSQSGSTQSKQPEYRHPPKPPISPEQIASARRWVLGVLGGMAFVGILTSLPSNNDGNEYLADSVADNLDAAADTLDEVADTAAAESNYLDASNLVDALPANLDDTPQERVEFVVVEKAANRFVSFLFDGGIIGARKFSENCAKSAKETASWQSVDACVAFDLTAAHLDEIISKEMKVPPNSYFQFQSKNASSLYEAAGAPSYSVSSRINQLRLAAEQAGQEALSDRISAMKVKEEAEARRLAESRRRAEEAAESVSVPEATHVDSNGEVRRD